MIYLKESFTGNLNLKHSQQYVILYEQPNK